MMMMPIIAPRTIAKSPVRLDPTKTYSVQKNGKSRLQKRSFMAQKNYTVPSVQLLADAAVWQQRTGFRPRRISSRATSERERLNDPEKIRCSIRLTLCRSLQKATNLCKQDSCGSAGTQERKVFLILCILGTLLCIPVHPLFSCTDFDKSVAIRLQRHYSFRTTALWLIRPRFLSVVEAF